jgi:hypothetical protein
MMPSIFQYMTQEQLTGLMKVAEPKPITHPVRHAIGTVGKGLIGFGVGTAGGYALGHLANAVFEKSTGKELPPNLLVPAASLLGAGMGMAYSLYKSKELEELQNAYKAHRDKSARGVPVK